jgi:hypothetical protein
MKAKARPSYDVVARMLTLALSRGGGQGGSRVEPKR